jgi:hypothetical protein
MSQVTGEDARRIREKYGDLLDKIEGEREPLSGQQCLDMLPPGAPRSSSIFTTGFYFNGRGVKYRTGFWSAVISYNALLIDLFLKVLVTSIIFGILAMYEKYEIPDIIFIVCLFAIGYTDSMVNLFNYTLFTNIEIDLNNRFLKTGHLIISKIPFKVIEEICIHKRRRGLRGGMIGTNIYLSSMHTNGIIVRFATFHRWEERHVKIISDSLMCLIRKEIHTKYISDEEENSNVKR